jgi:hypothetical protein
MTITYLDHNKVTAVRQTETPHNYSRTGYGNKLPTSWQIRVNKRWHRVYVVCWSNSGSAYVNVGKEHLYFGGWEPTDFFISNNKT